MEKQRDTTVPLKELMVPKLGGLSREAVFKGEGGDTHQLPQVKSSRVSQSALSYGWTACLKCLSLPQTVTVTSEVRVQANYDLSGDCFTQARHLAGLIFKYLELEYFYFPK